MIPSMMFVLNKSVEFIINTLDTWIKRDMYSGKFTSPVMGSSSLQAFGVLQNQRNIYKDDPVDVMRHRCFSKRHPSVPHQRHLMKIVCQPKIENHCMNN